MASTAREPGTISIVPSSTSLARETAVRNTTPRTKIRDRCTYVLSAANLRTLHLSTTMFLRNFPALVINDCLVIADVHIGITKELYHQGIAVPAQTKKMIDTLHKLKKTTQTKNLAIL